jgi:hypothetical protein
MAAATASVDAPAAVTGDAQQPARRSQLIGAASPAGDDYQPLSDVTRQTVIRE